MKVILTAFDGRLKSEIMEWPELPPDKTIYFPLRQVRHTYGGLYAATFDGGFDEPIDLRATFKGTGKTFEQADGSLAVEYELVNVDPKHWDDGGRKERERDSMMLRLALQKAMEIAENPDEAKKVAEAWGLLGGGK